jgi:hypothetical protein
MFYNITLNEIVKIIKHVFWMFIDIKKYLKWNIKTINVKKGTNFLGLSTTKNRWMYEIVTLFANFGVLRTNFIFFKFNYKYLGKITPKFLGMARHLGSA